MSEDGENLYCLDSNGFLGNIGGDPSAAAKMKTNELYLLHIPISEVNFDPRKKPVAAMRQQIVPPKDPVPRQSSMNGAADYLMKRTPSSRGGGYDSSASQPSVVKGKPPSVLMQNGL